MVCGFTCMFWSRNKQCHAQTRKTRDNVGATASALIGPVRDTPSKMPWSLMAKETPPSPPNAFQLLLSWATSYSFPPRSRINVHIVRQRNWLWYRWPTWRGGGGEGFSCVLWSFSVYGCSSSSIKEQLQFRCSVESWGSYCTRTRRSPEETEQLRRSCHRPGPTTASTTTSGEHRAALIASTTGSNFMSFTVIYL